MLEFPGGNEIVHLLGVFTRSFFFSLSRYQIEHFQNRKRLLLKNFMGFEISFSRGYKQEGLRQRDTQTAMRSLLYYYTFAELTMRSVRSCVRICVCVLGLNGNAKHPLYCVC